MAGCRLYEFNSQLVLVSTLLCPVRPDRGPEGYYPIRDIIVLRRPLAQDSDVDNNQQQSEEEKQFSAEAAQFWAKLNRFLAEREQRRQRQTTDANAAAPDLCVFDIPDPSVRAAIATDSDDPALVYVPPETSANTDPYASQPRATAADADIAEIDAAVEREVAAGLDVAETRVCEM